MQELFAFNGIDARSGDYLLPEMTPEVLVQRARGQPVPMKVDLNELKDRSRQGRQQHFGVKEGVDPKELKETGWGVIFPYYAASSPEARRQAEICAALRPLLDLRKGQANLKNDYYREYRGVNAYRPGETKQEYLGRLGAGPGPVDPARVPYYLLIVASPYEVPFRVQYQLDVQYAVGRIYFDTVDEYESYAKSVVRAETSDSARSPRAAFFGVANPDDRATGMSAAHLVAPLAKILGDSKDLSNWMLTQDIGKAASKARLGQLLGGADTPSLLFTASHGMGFPAGDPLQSRHQGALLCQDWPGPKWKKPIPEDFYFSGDDLPSNADLHGLIAFNFACYGAGTPEYDDFSPRSGAQRVRLADRPFIAALHRRMLSLPRGGALAAIGHIDRAWGYSFTWQVGGNRSSEQLAVFESTMRRLMTGYPVGAAVEYFNERYAELASDLNERLEEAEFGGECDARQLAELWTSNNDARDYGVLGDPAVRLCFPNSKEPPLLRNAVSVTAQPSAADGVIVAAPARDFCVSSTEAPVHPNSEQEKTAAMSGDRVSCAIVPHAETRELSAEDAAQASPGSSSSAAPRSGAAAGAALDLGAACSHEALTGRPDSAQYAWTMNQREMSASLEGACVLAAGGGGSYQAALKILGDGVRSSDVARIVNLENVPTDGELCVVGYVCSSDAFAADTPCNSASANAFLGLQEYIRQTRGDAFAFTHTVPTAVGALDAVAALTVAAQLGVTVVNADGAGRVFPTAPLNIYAAKRSPPFPSCIASNAGQGLPPDRAYLDISADRPGRESELASLNAQMSVIFGGIAGLATYGMNGNTLKVNPPRRGSLRLALEIGLARKTCETGGEWAKQIVRLVEADSRYACPIFKGFITDVKYSANGRDAGYVVVSSNPHRQRPGRQLWIYNQNENVYACRTDRDDPYIMGPDSICYVPVKSDCEVFDNTDLFRRSRLPQHQDDPIEVIVLGISAPSAVLESKVLMELWGMARSKVGYGGKFAQAWLHA